MSMKKVNELIQELFKEVPIDWEEPKAITASMKVALAECYGKEGFRQYFDNAIKKQMKSIALNLDEETNAVRRGRLMVLLELYSLCKSLYNDYEKLKSIKLQ